MAGDVGLSSLLYTGSSKSLGHFLRPYISKTTIYDVLFEKTPEII